MYIFSQQPLIDTQDNLWQVVNPAPQLQNIPVPTRILTLSSLDSQPNSVHLTPLLRPSHLRQRLLTRLPTLREAIQGYPLTTPALTDFSEPLRFPVWTTQSLYQLPNRHTARRLVLREIEFLGALPVGPVAGADAIIHEADSRLVGRCNV